MSTRLDNRAAPTRRLLRTFVAEGNGGLLVEAVIAVAIFALVGTAVLSALSTIHSSGAKTEGQSVAENLGRNQMEYVFSLPYQEPPSAYPTIEPPSNYTVTALASEYVPGDPSIELITVTTSHGGQEVLVLETLRAKE